jgi:hypothetical protein
VDGALCFSAGETSRKGKNLARDPRCVVTAGSRAWILWSKAKPRR